MNYRNTKIWKVCKEIVSKRENGLCEDCKKHGISTKGFEFAFRIVPKEITEKNIRQVCIPGNIKLLCRDCKLKEFRVQRSKALKLQLNFTSTNKDMEVALVEFKKAAINLLTYWGNLSYDDTYSLLHGYPFDKDIGTTVSLIQTWVDLHTQKEGGI